MRILLLVLFLQIVLFTSGCGHESHPSAACRQSFLNCELGGEKK